MKINAHCKKEAVGSDGYAREILEMGERGREKKDKPSPGVPGRCPPEGWGPGLRSRGGVGPPDPPGARPPALCGRGAPGLPTAPRVRPTGRREWASRGRPELRGHLGAGGKGREKHGPQRGNPRVGRGAREGGGGELSPVPPRGRGEAAGCPQPAPRDRREPRLL